MDMRTDKTLGEMGAPPHMETAPAQQITGTYCKACDHAVWGHGKTGCFHAQGLGVNRKKCTCTFARRPEVYNPDTHILVAREEWDRLVTLVEALSGETIR